MKAAGIDERMMVRERIGADFLVFFYEGDERPGTSVDSYLLTDTDIPAALLWVRETAPPNCCWSLGVVISPAPATTGSELEIAWIVGADVFNIDPANRTDAEGRLAEEMLARRERVELA